PETAASVAAAIAEAFHERLAVLVDGGDLLRGKRLLVRADGVLRDRMPVALRLPRRLVARLLLQVDPPHVRVRTGIESLERKARELADAVEGLLRVLHEVLVTQYCETLAETRHAAGEYRQVEGKVMPAQLSHVAAREQ